MICFLKASSPLLFPQKEVTDWHKEEERHGAGPRAGRDGAPAAATARPREEFSLAEVGRQEGRKKKKKEARGV